MEIGGVFFSLHLKTVYFYFMKKVLTFCTMTVAILVSGQETTFDDLKLILAREATVDKEEENVVHYSVDQLPVYLIVDEDANRMRLMSPVVETKDLSEEDLNKLMESNFDRALDAKYAISEGILWSVYAHPLRELYKDQIIDAFNQVRNLVYNYGTSYASTTMLFGGEGG